MLNDLRHALRLLVKTPTVTIVAVVSIAIGVGASATTFSVADAILLRPLPVPRAAEVMTVAAISPSSPIPGGLSYPEFVELREAAQSLASPVAYEHAIAGVATSPTNPAVRMFGAAISANLFEAMDVDITLGRAFRPDEDAVSGRGDVVILDFETWRQQLGQDPAVLGKRLRIRSADFVIVGVAPPGFTGIDYAIRPAFYVPLTMLPVLEGLPNGALMDRRRTSLTIKTRLRPGVTRQQADDEVRQLAAAWQRDYAETNANRTLTVRTELQTRTSGLGGRSQVTLAGALLALAAIILLIGCANVAALLASRAPARAREMAVRVSVGAGRLLLLRQLLTESLLLALCGGALGVLLGAAGIAAFSQIEIDPDTPLKITFELDARVVWTALTVAVISTIAASLLPAWRTSRADLITLMKSRANEPPHRLWGRHALVCIQISLSLLLLAAAVSLSQGTGQLLAQGPGFRTDHLVMMTFDGRMASYDDPQLRDLATRLRTEAGRLPGARAASLTSSIPLHNRTRQRLALVPQGLSLPPDTASLAVLSSRIDEHYLDAMGIQLRAGRGIAASDTAAAPAVAVVNDTFAERYWPSGNAIGQRLRLEDGRTAEIVGVVAASKYNSMQEAPLDFVYVPWTQHPTNENTLIVRTNAPSAELISGLRVLLRDLAPEVPAFGVRTIEDYYDAKGVRTVNLLNGVVTAIGGLGFGLALLGLYGLVSYAVAQRRKEIGIRVAVGAAPASILALFVRRWVWLSSVGVVLGIVLTPAANGIVRALMPAGEGLDVSAYLWIVPGVMAFVLLAASGPARAAMAARPAQILRE